MGYYQSDLHLRRHRLFADARRGRRRWPDHRRPARPRKTKTLPAALKRRLGLHPARDAHDRRPLASGARTNTSGFVYYVSITGVAGAPRPTAGKVNAAVARIKRAHRAAGCGRLRRAHGERRAPSRAPMALVVGSALVGTALRLGLDKNGDATRAPWNGDGTRWSMACARSAVGAEAVRRRYNSTSRAEGEA